jgi:cyclophilin family peptidyl-prolyl cis-trans isomerase
MRFIRFAVFFISAFALALSLPNGLRAQSTAPALSTPLPAQSLTASGAAGTLDLKNYFTLPGVTGQVVQFTTVLGNFNVEMFGNDAPTSVSNFLIYAAAGTYTNTLIHRFAALGANNGNRIVQGGGYDTAGNSVPKLAPIALEYKLPNTRGTIAMARSTDLNSATSEWFFNVDDNTTALGQANNGGYAVFGRVLGTGMTDVVDKIAAVPTFNAGGAFTNIPLRDVQSGQTTIQPQNLIIVNSVKVANVYPNSANGAPAVIAFSVSSSNPAVVTASLSDAALTLTPVAGGTATVTVTATDTNGNTATGTVNVSVAGANAAPTIAQQPASKTIAQGGTVVFSVTATGSPAPNYQWQRNNTNIQNATGASLVIANAGAADLGSYTVMVSNSVGNVTSSAATLTLSTNLNDPGRLTNLSILTPLALGETMTMGTVLGGAGTSGTKPLLVRAAGPSLAQFGIATFLPDPTLTLVNTTSTPSVTVATNNDWGGGAPLTNAFAAVGAFAYTAGDSKDAALFQGGTNALQPGNYTVQVKDNGSGFGTVIAELYDSTPAGTFTSTTPRLINVSVLKQISAGSSLTTGFVITGASAKTVLIRAIGPGLAPLGVAGTMADPQLTLFNSASAVIATNDDWGGDPQIRTVGTRVGAFDIANASSKDAILLVTLAAGSYTARANPASGTAGGTAIVEVYEVP